jgi:hypothetical protein
MNGVSVRVLKKARGIPSGSGILPTKVFLPEPVNAAETAIVIAETARLFVRFQPS